MAREHIQLGKNIQIGNSTERIIDVTDLTFRTAVLRNKGVVLCSYIIEEKSIFNLIRVDIVRDSDMRYNALRSQLGEQD